jgi:putative oxidoreductase
MTPAYKSDQRNLTYAQEAALLVARIGLASLFLFSGCQKLTDLHGAAVWGASQGVPFASLLMPLAGLFEVASAVMLITGWHARQAAAALAVWIIVLGPLFHRFWQAPPQLWQFVIDDLFHHFVMFGGMLYVVVFGPGSWPLGRTQN